MKRFAMWAVLMLCAGTAFGQTVGSWGQANRQPSNATSPSVPAVKMMIVGGINGADTTFIPFTFNSSGYQLMTDPLRDRSNWVVYSSAIDDTVSNGANVGTAWSNVAVAAAFSAESTSVYPAAEYRRFAIQIWAKAAGADTTTRIRLAVQVRGHSAQNSDTTSTAVWSGWCSGGGDVDSTGDVTLGISGGGQSLAWSGERIFNFDPRRGNGALGYDQAFGAPNGKLVELVDSRNGNYFWAPYISIRVREIGGPTGKIRVTMNLMMGS